MWLKASNRFEEIVTTIAKHELGYVLEKLGLRKISLHTPLPNHSPENIKALLEDLGGVFVKLGQLLSLRPDLLPWQYCEELSKLQDQVSPVPFKELEPSLKQVLPRLQSIIVEPVASASIGQVHKAVLDSGEAVAVKVKKPGVDEVFREDVEILVFIANQLEKRLKPKAFSPSRIVAEFKDYCEKELDLYHEALSLEDFWRSAENVKVPKPFLELCSKDVLVMQFLEGEKLREWADTARSSEKAKVAEVLAKELLRQVFKVGRFHADPHPGNVLVDDGVVSLLDFGITGRVSEKVKESLSQLLIGLVGKDLDLVAKALLRLNFLNKEVDVEAFKEDTSLLFGKYYDAPLSEVKVSTVVRDSLELARRHGLTLPRNFVLLGKAVITMEGTCAELNPDFNFVEVAKPFALELLKDSENPAKILSTALKSVGGAAELLRDAPEMAAKAYRAVLRSEDELEKLSENLEKVERDVKKGDLTTAFSILAGFFMVTGALLARTPQPGLLGLPIYSLLSFATAGAFLLVLTLSFLEERLGW